MPYLPEWLRVCVRRLPRLPHPFSLPRLPDVEHLHQVTKRGIVYWVIGLLIAASACYHFQIVELGRDLYCSTAGVRVYVPKRYTDAVKGQIPFDDVLCYPRKSALRDLQAQKTPRYCLQFDLPKPYRDLACDFEAHGYCSGYTCRFWIQSLKNFVKEQPTSTRAAADNLELSLKVVNMMLGAVEAEFGAITHRLEILFDIFGYINPQEEEHALRIALQASAVLIWHCDETRTRAFRPKEGTWATTLNHLVKMDLRLVQYGAQVGCRGDTTHPPATTYCDEIYRTSEIFDLLIPEFRRRAQWRFSQCPAPKEDL